MVDYYARTGEEVMNDTTRRQIMIDMMPPDIKRRMHELIEVNPRATIPQLNAAAINSISTASQ